jgi:hypothetical protein
MKVSVGYPVSAAIFNSEVSIFGVEHSDLLFIVDFSTSGVPAEVAGLVEPPFA